jgi:hypothetical protein
MRKGARSRRAAVGLPARSRITMRLYMFRSAIDRLNAFSFDAEGSDLPPQFKPWTADGFVESGAQPPHNLSRFKIESALKLVGFQLWRRKDNGPHRE